MQRLLAVGSLVALSPVAASAQTASAPTTPRHAAHHPRGSYRSEMHKRRNMSRDRARASAEHMRQMRNSWRGVRLSGVPGPLRPAA